MQQPLTSVPFEALANEASVRELVCHPLLLAMGFREPEIRREPLLDNPFIATGSEGRRGATLRPDYLAQRGGRYLLVLEAKAPDESVDHPHHVQQAYSYAVHPEVRAPLYAICNGRHLALWRTADPQAKPALRIDLARWPEPFIELMLILSQVADAPVAADAGHTLAYDYGAIPLPNPFRPERQSVKRHFGVHPYFTRQPYSVVRGHIEHFTQPGDLVLDPFGGSGVTAIEAMMLGRRACHVDINPLSTFIVKNLAEPVDLRQLSAAAERICSEYERLEPQDEAAVRDALRIYPRPLPLALPRDADVPTADQLFSDAQTARLGLLRHLIVDNCLQKKTRESLLLCFSSLITKINLTFQRSYGRHGRPAGGGDAAAFIYYRYRLAKRTEELPVLPYFQKRVSNLLAAKREMAPYINRETVSRLQVVTGSATQMGFLADGSVDYIYTDPPYGAKIPYLDLSAMWLAWLDLRVDEELYAQEAIQGGSRGKTKAEYNDLMRASIREMYRVLRYDRWLSFVYAHKDPAFWHMIVEEAERCGFEYRGAVSQPVGKVSFKKHQRPFTVLSGQLVVHFYKSRRPSRAVRGALSRPIVDALTETIESTIATHHGATIEQINDAIIIRGLEQGFLDQLQREYQDLTPLLADSYAYDEKTGTYHLRPKGRFASAIPLESRIRYYLTSILRRENAMGRYPSIETLVLGVIPLLKNGVTPPEQTILDELRRIAHQHDNGWRLNGMEGLF